MGSSPIPATRPVGQAVKTPPFHGGNSSSILLRVTKRNKSELFRQSKLVRICFLLLNYHIDAVLERGHGTSLYFIILSTSSRALIVSPNQQYTDITLHQHLD